MTKTIYELFKGSVALKEVKGSYGIEIETEATSSNDYPRGFLVTQIDPDHGEYWETPKMPYWKGVYDGSLRNYGVEFVFQKPLDYAEACLALDEFKKATADVKFIKDPPGTSVHVHINILHETPIILANFLTTLSLFENLLTEYSGPNRRSNLFALPMRVAEENRTNIIRLLQAIDKGDNKAIVFSDQHVKYAVINLATLSKYGSVEIRCFRGTTDADEIKKWLTILSSIRSFSQSRGLTPRDILKAYESRGSELLSEIFGPLAAEVKVPGYESLIDRALWNTGMIATCVKDWKSFGDNYKKPPKTARQMHQEVTNTAPASLINSLSAFSQLYAGGLSTLTIPDEDQPATDNPWLQLNDVLPTYEDDDDV